MSEQIYDTVIVGSGPAGLTAAIYNIRAALKTLVLAGNMPGGQLTITTIVENYPGFARGIGGTKLMMETMEQVKNLGGEIKYGEVKEIKKGEKIFEIRLADGTAVATRAVIVATGALAKWLGLPNEKELVGRGVSGCATCDGMFFRDKLVAVVGGGDVACQDADFLAKFASKVLLLHRRNELRAGVLNQKKVTSHGKIEIWWNSEVMEIVGKEKLEAIKVVIKPGPRPAAEYKPEEMKEEIVKIDGLFVAVGHDPATGFIKDLIKLDETGRIVLGSEAKYPMMTSVPGIFAAGDCVDGRYRQAIVAAGDGCRAAMEAEWWLGEQRLKT